jgi:translation elongation factor EF-1alpha
MTEHLVGTVSHYYDKLKVAGVDLSGKLQVGDTVHILGHTSDFTQIVDSIQVEHEAVVSALPGEPIAIKVSERTRVHDKVLVVTPDGLECV